MNKKNSKVFEQKDDLLGFKVNIDPKSGESSQTQKEWKIELSLMFSIFLIFRDYGPLHVKSQ